VWRVVSCWKSVTKQSQCALAVDLAVAQRGLLELGNGRWFDAQRDGAKCRRGHAVLGCKLRLQPFRIDGGKPTHGEMHSAPHFAGRGAFLLDHAFAPEALDADAHYGGKARLILVEQVLACRCKASAQLGAVLASSDFVHLHPCEGGVNLQLFQGLDELFGFSRCFKDRAVCDVAFDVLGIVHVSLGLGEIGCCVVSCRAVLGRAVLSGAVMWRK